MAGDMIDLQKYPIDNLHGAAGQALLAQCRQHLATDGAAVLPGFLTPAAVERIAAQSRAAAPQAFFCDSTHNVYLAADDPAFPAEHPRRKQLHTVVGSVAYDLLEGTELRRLYQWDALVDFVREVLQVPQLYRLADPLGACSINVFRPGDQHQWHFDEAEYTTTIMLQEAQEGGYFDYVADLRRPDGSEAARIATLLDGDERGVRRLPFTAGALSIFGGRRALHRVTTVVGDRDRLVAVLTFNSRPGVTNSDAVRQLFWGRVA